MFGFFSTSAQPSRVTRTLLGIPLFALLFALYLGMSYVRHQDNPDDKIFPTVTQLVQGVEKVATEPDRMGKIWLWSDLEATSKRFGMSLALVSTGIVLGLMMGLFPMVEAFSLNFIIVLNEIVALSLLPLLMVLLGIEEGFRVGLVVIGVFPSIVLGAYLEAKAYPEELKTKAKTIGASDWALAFRVVLPGIMPKMLDLLRLNFKSIASLVIAGEMIVASEGLGFRINFVRHSMEMDVVIVYVAIITVVLFLAEVLVTCYINWRYPWFNKA